MDSGSERPLIALAVEEPATPLTAELPALQRVQVAVAADLRQRLDGVAGLTWEDARPRLRIRPGAGALLTAQRAAELAAALLTLPAEALVLPFEGAARQPLPCNAGTCFAVLGGADLLALSLHPDAGPATQRALAELQLDARRLAAALSHFANRDSEVAVCGPIQSRNWQYIEEQVACRVRVFADAGGERGALAGMLYRSAAPGQFMTWLRSMGDAALLDSRQLLDDPNGPSASDFFWSDLGRPEAVRHAGLRQLTEATLAATFPVILGGPSLVNGALYALVETAWRTGRDVDRGYRIAW